MPSEGKNDQLSLIILIILCPLLPPVLLLHLKVRCTLLKSEQLSNED